MGTSPAISTGSIFPPKELESELERARAGRIGTPIGRLLLLCYDYDAATGKYTLSILRLIRVLGTATAVALAGFMFVMFRREGRQRRMNLAGPEPVAGGRTRSSVHVPLSRGNHFIMWNFPLFPDQASTMARQVDALYFFELGVAAFFTALICIFI